MPTRLKLLSLLSFTFVALSFGSVAKAEDYAIKLERPSKAGEEYRSTTTTTSEMSRVVKKDGMKVEEVTQKMVVSLVGDEKVLEVTDKGKPSKIECVVVKCERTADGQTAEVVATGKKILAQRGGKKTSFKIDNADVAPDVAAALELVLTVGDPDKPSDDVTFGTPEKKKVGDTWKSDTDIIFSTLKKENIPLQKDGLASSMKLADVKTVGGKQLMTIEGNITAPVEAGGKFKGFPEWLSVSQGKMDMKLSKTQPVDPSAQTVGEKLDMTVSMTAAGKAPDGSAITIDVTMRRASEGIAQYK